MNQSCTEVLNPLDTACCSSPLELPKLPSIVAEAKDYSDISTYKVELNDLPPGWRHENVSQVWIACCEAWPHVDEPWRGFQFVTLVISADHTLCALNSKGEVDEVAISPGTLFVLDPLRLHWLRPNCADNNPGFAGLQWEVPTEDVEHFFQKVAPAARWAHRFQS